MASPSSSRNDAKRAGLQVRTYLASLPPDARRRLRKLREAIRGAAAVAETFSGRARAAQPALVNGVAGLAWAPGGRPRVVFGFTITRGKIVEIELVADPERLRQLDLAVLDN